MSKKILTLDEAYAHLFERDYMSGVERDDARVKAYGEVFTPTSLVDEVLDTLDQELFMDPDRTFIDPACGDGQFLASVLWRKLQNDIKIEDALRTIYGVDIQIDNVIECQKRLLCGQDHLQEIVNENIVEANALTYDFVFEGLDTNTRPKFL